MQLPTEPRDAVFPDLSRYRNDNIPRGAAVSRTTAALREAILDGVLEPGMWLREESLTADLGVSRTPLREALNRLAEEGLVTREHGIGARVTALTVEDMSVVYQVRGSLESVAASIAAERATPDQRQRLVSLAELMRAAAGAGQVRDFSDLNIEFHATLASASTNAYLRRLLGTVETAIRRFGTRTYSDLRMEEILAEHERIVEAIMANDSPAAAQAASDHARSAQSATLQRLLGADSTG